MSTPQKLTKDWLWKVLSLVLAVVIWGVVNKITDSKPVVVENPLAQRVDRTITGVPVLVVSSAADVRECKVQPDTVTVSIRGAPEIMAQVLDREIEVRVDLTDIESARSLRKRVVVSTPPGVTFVSVEPAEVDVVIPAKRK